MASSLPWSVSVSEGKGERVGGGGLPIHGKGGEYGYAYPKPVHMSAEGKEESKPTYLY